MTPKERARLRGLANGIDTVLQIGKDGIGDTLIHQADITLEARELIKGRVLDSCMDYTPRTAAETLAAATHSEVVQVIGSKFVLYRKKKEVPKKKPLSRPGQKSKADNRSERVDKAEKFGNRLERVRKAEKFGNRLERVRKAEKPGNRPAHVRKAEKPANSKARKPGNPARKTPSSGNRPAHVRKAEKPGNRPKRGDAPRRNHSATPKTRK
ncbi:MAG: YhbY family RNA-binding protein [Oscillospiraceae bacterium]|nr:YhbY family RNA-binding protein [Oscillospiraceae bacterium]